MPLLVQVVGLVLACTGCCPCLCLYRLLPLSLLVRVVALVFAVYLAEMEVVTIELTKLVALLLCSWITFCFLLCLNTCVARLMYISCFCFLCCIVVNINNSAMAM